MIFYGSNLLGILTVAFGRQYRYMTYDEIVTRAFSLGTDFPACARVFNALNVWPELVLDDVCFY